MNRGFRAGFRAYSSFFGPNQFRKARAGVQFAQFSTMNTQYKMAQLQMTNIQASNFLLTGIKVNDIIGNEEAEAGVVSVSSEDAELEEDDG